LSAIGRLTTIGAIAALALAAAVPAGAGGSGGLVFRPPFLPAGKVGVPYQVVIRVSRDGHDPALGKNYPSYTVDCFGATPTGGFVDDCSKLPPGLKLTATYSSPSCSPPLQKPHCVLISGTPKKAGRFSFDISAPDVTSLAVRGVLRLYTIVIAA